MLRLARRFELLHLPLSSSRRLVRIFRSVVHPFFAGRVSMPGMTSERDSNPRSRLQDGSFQRSGLFEHLSREASRLEARRTPANPNLVWSPAALGQSDLAKRKSRRLAPTGSTTHAAAANVELALDLPNLKVKDAAFGTALRCQILLNLRVASAARNQPRCSVRCRSRWLTDTRDASWAGRGDRALGRLDPSRGDLWAPSTGTD